jgi:hypothetical protein
MSLTARTFKSSKTDNMYVHTATPAPKEKVPRFAGVLSSDGQVNVMGKSNVTGHYSMTLQYRKLVCLHDESRRTTGSCTGAAAAITWAACGAMWRNGSCPLSAQWIRSFIAMASRAIQVDR